MTRFGLLVPHFGLEADQDLLVEGAQLAESLGFDSLWVRDHLVFHPHGMEGTDRTFIEPLITLTYLAGKTETATLFVQNSFESFDTTGAYAASVLLALIAIATLVAMNVFRPKEETR